MKPLADPVGEFDLGNVGQQPRPPEPQPLAAQSQLPPPEQPPEQPAEDPTQYTAAEEQQLKQYAEQAEKLLFENDESHQAAMNMIKHATADQERAPEGLADATMNVVGAVDQHQGEAGIPEELVPGLAIEVLDMTLEMATDFLQQDLGKQFRSQAMSAVMTKVSEAYGLGDGDGMMQMLAHGGVRSDADMQNIMNVVKQATFSEQERNRG